jgi:predicted transcriptional regulator
MNTVMEEKIKQAFQEWKQTEVKELIVETNSRNQQLSNVLLDMISKNPGITGKDLRVYVAKEMPTVPISYVPAILKGFYDKNFVNRIEVAPDGEKGRTTFSYTAVPVAVRKTMPKREKVKAYTKKKVKVAKVKEDKGITGLVPAERVTTHPLAVGATTLHITISTSLGAYSMQLEEAKFIYTQLNQIFGGVR